MSLNLPLGCWRTFYMKVAVVMTYSHWSDLNASPICLYLRSSAFSILWHLLKMEEVSLNPSRTNLSHFFTFSICYSNQKVETGMCGDRAQNAILRMGNFGILIRILLGYIYTNNIVENGKRFPMHLKKCAMPVVGAVTLLVNGTCWEVMTIALLRLFG